MRHNFTFDPITALTLGIIMDLNLVRNTPHYVLSFCKVLLNLLQ